MAKPTKKARRLAALKGWRKRNPRRRNAGGTSTASRTATRTATEATTTGNKTSTSTGGASTSGGNVSISVKHNPAARVGGKGVTLHNMASITIKRLPGGAVAITGRKLAGGGRANPGFYRDYEAERGRGDWGVVLVGQRYRAEKGAGNMTKREAQQAAKNRNSGGWSSR